MRLDDAIAKVIVDELCAICAGTGELRHGRWHRRCFGCDGLGRVMYASLPIVPSPNDAAPGYAR